MDAGQRTSRILHQQMRNPNGAVLANSGTLKRDYHTLCFTHRNSLFEGDTTWFFVVLLPNKRTKSSSNWLHSLPESTLASTNHRLACWNGWTNTHFLRPSLNLPIRWLDPSAQEKKENGRPLSYVIRCLTPQIGLYNGCAGTNFLFSGRHSFFRHKSVWQTWN